MKTILRLLFFWIKVIAVALLIVALAGLSFFVAMDVVNLSILIKDGMTLRSNVIFAPDDYDAENLTKFFTEACIAQDATLNNNPYLNFDIEGYDYNTKIERIFVWPWQDEMTATIACTQNTLSGSLKEEFMTAEQAESGEVIRPTKLDNTRYHITCTRTENAWIISDLQFVETFEDDETMKGYERMQQKEEEPEASESAEGEETPAEGTEE